MIWWWLRRLDARLRLLVPFLLALCAALIDVLPLHGLGAWGLSPFSLLCVVYFWSLYRPDLFGPVATFASGIVYDALAGLPLGLSALVLLLARQFVVAQRRFFVARSFLVVWICFLLLAPGVELEASGGISLKTISDVARTGVERISAGAITHSAVTLDLAFDWVPTA